MKNLLLALALSLVPALSGAVEVKVRTRTGGGGSVVGPMAPAVGVSGSPSAVELSVPSLGAGLAPAAPAPDLSAPGLEISPSPDALDLPVSAAGLEAALPSPTPLSAAPGEAQGRAPAVPGGAEARAGVVAAPQDHGQDAAEEGAQADADEGPSLAAASLFDGAGEARSAPAAPGLWQRFKTYLRPDIIPSWPGRTGDVVRMGGTARVLGNRIGESHASTVWSVQGDPRVVIKLVTPEMRGDSHYGQEVEALQALAHTQLPHSRLLAASPDGLVMVKEFVEGEDLRTLVARGGLQPSRLSALAGFVSELIRIGYTADLAPSNVFFERWRSQWTLVDAGGFKPGRPLDVLGQVWRDAVFGADAAGAVAARRRFLTHLRTRLGPGSPQWKEIKTEATRIPSLRKALEELARFDAERPPPKVVFRGQDEDPVLSDRMVSYSQVTASLGYDPLSVRERQRLHMDDQGKLNTVLHKISPPGKAPMVVKLANADIIRRELAVRRIVRRWFSAYFATPRSLGWGDGMVMEFSDGSPDYFGKRLTMNERVAFAILAHSFGLADVNAGNVLHTWKGRPVLIDFEQSLSRVHPTFGRLSIDSIISEMPWMARSADNRLQDYQPSIAEWRRIFAKPETQKELEKILLESSFAKAEVPALLAAFRYNVSLLELSVLADVEYANAYAEAYGPTARPSSP